MSHSYKAFILLMIISIGHVYGQISQSLQFENINNAHGIPNNSVNDIIQDNLGFIWIATNDGLCRYEGANRVKIYRANSNENVEGLQSNNIRSLLLDSRNNLWIGTRLGGVTRFNQAQNTWTTYRSNADDPNSLCNDEILTIHEDRQGRIWVGTEDGISVYDAEREEFTSFKMDAATSGALKAKAVLSIYEDDKGWIWAGTWEGGLYLLTLPENGALKEAKFRNFLVEGPKQSNRVWDIYQDKQRRYWLGTAGAGLYLMQLPELADNSFESSWRPTFHNFKNSTEENSLSHDDIKDILQDRDNNLWVATSNGLNSITAHQLEQISATDTDHKYELDFTNYYNQFENPKSLINDNNRKVFEDNQGLIWVATYGGISQYNWTTNQFDIHESNIDMTKNPIYQNLIIDHQGSAWIGNGEKGLLKYNFETKEVKKILEHNSTFGFISSLHSADNKHLYFGHSEGVGVIDIETEKVKSYNIFNHSEKLNIYSKIRSILKDSKNRIWVGSEDGLFIINENSGEISHYLRDDKDPTAICDNTINQIIEDSRGDIWLATYQGINKVEGQDLSKLQFIKFKHDKKNPQNSLPSNRIVAIVEINGILYLGGNSGLHSYDLTNQVFTNHSENENMYSFLSLQSSDDQNLWGSTADGIIFYDTKNGIFNQYDHRDGLSALSFCQRSSYYDSEGYLNFGSHRGITRFNPSELDKNTTPPPVFITDLKTISSDGESLSSATYLKEFTITQDDYYLSLDYTALNFNRPEKNQYAYMLEGFDEDWAYPNIKSPAVYTNLAPGVYTFKVKAANNDGVWNEEGKSLTIIREPSLQERTSFKLLLVLLGALALYLGLKYYTKNILERNKLLKRYNEDLNNEISQRRHAEEALQKEKINLKKLNQSLEKVNSELERSNKDLEQFANIASHDLQEPLRVVSNYVGLIKYRYHDPLDQDSAQYFDFIISGVKRMSDQIRSILTFSRMRQNRLNISTVNLNEVLRAVSHDLSQKIEESNAEIIIDDMPIITCDKDLIRTVFYNLINNGVKFNKQDLPLVHVSYQDLDDSDRWQFSVRDNGIGIPEDHQMDIFNIFTRLHNKTDYEGTGIGLALCKKVVERHIGNIWLDSIENEGTTFHFTISKRIDHSDQ